MSPSIDAAPGAFSVPHPTQPINKAEKRTYFMETASGVSANATTGTSTATNGMHPNRAACSRVFGQRPCRGPPLSLFSAEKCEPAPVRPRQHPGKRKKRRMPLGVAAMQDARRCGRKPASFVKRSARRGQGALRTDSCKKFLREMLTRRRPSPAKPRRKRFRPARRTPTRARRIPCKAPSAPPQK